MTENKPEKFSNLPPITPAEDASVMKTHLLSNLGVLKGVSQKNPPSAETIAATSQSTQRMMNNGTLETLSKSDNLGISIPAGALLNSPELLGIDPTPKKK